MMLKKMVSWIAALSIATAGIAVRAEETTEYFPDVLYELDLSKADDTASLSELGLTVKSGNWEFVHDDGGSYLKSTDTTAALMVQDINEKDYQLEVEYQQDSGLPDDALYYSGSNAKNYMLKNTVYVRSGDTMNSGTGFYKWIFTNPGQYSSKSFQGYFGGSAVVNGNYESTDAASKVKTNQKQNIRVAVRDKDEKNTALAAEINQGVFSMPADHWHSAASVSGKIGMEWRVVLGSNYKANEIGYAVKVYKIKVTGKKPAAVEKDSALTKESQAYQKDDTKVKDYGCVARISYYHGEKYGFRLSYTTQENETKTAQIQYNNPARIEGSPDVIYGMQVNGVPEEYVFDMQPYLENAD